MGDNEKGKYRYLSFCPLAKEREREESILKDRDIKRQGKSKRCLNKKSGVCFYVSIDSQEMPPLEHQG